MSEKIFNNLFFGLFLAASLVLSAIFVGGMFYKSKLSDRYVTVKGLAVKEVKANLAIWEINFNEVGANLVDVNQQIEKSREKVIEFLKAQGFSDQEIEKKTSKVTDLLANPYSTPNADPNIAQRRYILVSGVRVRTNKVDLVQKSNQLVSELLRQGVSLNFEASDVGPNPSYIFNQLDSIRPQMLAEATHSARLVAEQFAKDSDSRLGDIRRANQGIFQLMPRDAADTSENQNEATSINKRVRLVTTVEYFLSKK